MKSEHLVGTSIPRFTFDTPTTPGNDFYKLCEGEHPLVMIFLPAFDHPVTGKRLSFESPLPSDMVTVIDKWRNYIAGRD